MRTLQEEAKYWYMKALDDFNVLQGEARQNAEEEFNTNTEEHFNNVDKFQVLLPIERNDKLMITYADCGFELSSKGQDKDLTYQLHASIGGTYDIRVGKFEDRFTLKSIDAWNAIVNHLGKHHLIYEEPEDNDT